MYTCQAIKINGSHCSTKIEEGERCKRHCLKNYGPNETRVVELGYIHKRKKREIIDRYIRGDIDDTEKKREMRMEKIRHETSILNLEDRIREETIASEGDADEPYKQRRILIRIQRAERIRDRWRDYINHIVIPGFNHMNVIGANGNINHAVQENLGEMGMFAHDKQNVHREVVVCKVKETVEKILKIAVPPEYKTETFKTVSEILTECNLSKPAALQMSQHYFSDNDIYELGPGIYASILNGVWQFIKASEHSEDLKKILKIEMEDNIGMCAQGNLTRLCNILSGYIDMVEVRSLMEIIADKLSSLLELDDVRERLVQARSFLDSNKVPRENWKVWLLPLLEEENCDDIPPELLA